MSGLASAGTTAVLALLAIAAGCGLAQLLPRRPQGRRRAAVSGAGLLGAGIGARLAVEMFNLPFGLIILIASYGFLVAACLLNLTRPGTPIVALGLFLMLGPTVVNGGMPVSARALASMGLHPSSSTLPGERHVEVERDQLRVLGDVLPLPLGGRPVSFGELIALVGLADVAFNEAGRKGRRARRPAPGAVQRLDPSLVLEEPIDDEPTVVVLGPVYSRTALEPRRTRRQAAVAQATRTGSHTATASIDPFGEDPFGEDPFAEDPFAEDRFAEDRFGEDRFAEDRFAEDHFGGDRFVDDLFADRPFADRPFADGPSTDAPLADRSVHHDGRGDRADRADGPQGP